MNEEYGGLTFGLALEAIKEGQRVARRGWNGQGMFLWLNEGSINILEPKSAAQGIPLKLFNREAADGTTTRLPNINMRNALGATVTGWLASQSDMLAEDWEVING